MNKNFIQKITGDGTMTMTAYVLYLIIETKSI